MHCNVSTGRIVLSVKGMDQRGRNDVAVKDAPIKPSKVGYALDMEQRGGYVTLKDAQS